MACSGGRWFETMGKETTALWGNLAKARELQLASLGEMPLVVLSQGAAEMPTGPGISAADVEGFWVAYQEMQAELAALSIRGKQIVAEGCSHHIHIERPELVVDAIREVVEAARAPS
jgi:hypothetical protein